MPGRIQISGGLFACMLAIFAYTATLLLVPATLFKLAGQSAWLGVVLGGIGGSLIGLFALYVGLRDPKLTAAQTARQLMGKWLGGGVGLLYSALFVWIFSLSLRDVIDFVQMMLLPGTPGRVIAALMAAVALYSAWDGIETTARVSFQVLVAVGSSLLFLPLLLYREFSILQIEPFLWRGVAPVLESALLVMPWYGETVIVLTLVRTLKNRRQAYRWYLVGAAASVFLLTFLVVLTTLVFGPDLPGRFIFPIYMLVQQISVARVIERIEVVLITVWLSGMFIKLAMCLYASAEGLAHSIGVKSHRWPAAILALVGVLLSQVWTGALDVFHFTTTPSWVISTLAVEVAIPTTLLIASLLHAALKRKGSTHA